MFAPSKTSAMARGVLHFFAFAGPLAVSALHLPKFEAQPVAHEVSGSSGAWSAVGHWLVQDPWLQLLNVMLFLPACYILWTYGGKGKSKDTKMGLGMNTAFQMVLFCVYIFNGTTHMFLQERAGSTKYSPVAATVLIYVGKSVVAGGMHVRQYGWDFSALNHPAGGRFGAMPAFLCTALPGALFASYDMFSFVSLSHIDPVTYQVVMHCRIFLSATIWQIAFNRWCSGTQWLSMFMFVTASIAQSFDELKSSGKASDGAYNIVAFGLMAMLLQIFISAFNSVLSEVLLKELPVTTDLQNCATYTQGLIFLALSLLVRQGPTALYDELLSQSAWSRFFGDPWMVASVTCLIAHGIFTAYFLREMSVVLKEMSGCVVTVVAAILEWAVLRSSPCTMVGVQAVIVVAMALLVYNVDPLAARKGNEETEPAAVAKTGLAGAALPSPVGEKAVNASQQD